MYSVSALLLNFGVGVKCYIDASGGDQNETKFSECFRFLTDGWQFRILCVAKKDSSQNNNQFFFIVFDLNIWNQSKASDVAIQCNSNRKGLRF